MVFHDHSYWSARPVILVVRRSTYIVCEDMPMGAQ